MLGMAAPGHESEPINIRILIDSVPALVHRARPDGYLNDLNKRCLEHLGRSLEQVESWRWTNSIRPDEVAGILSAWRACGSRA